MKILSTSFAIMMGMFLVQGCSSSDSDGNEQTDSTKQQQEVVMTLELTTEQQTMVTEGNAFAFLLMQKEHDIQQGSSFVLSPLSVGFMLGMLNEGAQGQTRQEITQVLGVGNFEAANVNEYYQRMMTASPLVDPEVTLAIANMLYANKAQNAVFADGFTATMKKSYNAGIESLDFTQPSALQAINNWCSSHTNGKIEKILNPDEFDAQAVCYTLNSVYFNAPWSVRFDTNATKQKPFRKADGEELKVDMMNMQGKVGYYLDNDLQAIGLPYGNGSYEMMVIMPVSEGDEQLSGLIGKLTTDRWVAMTKVMKLPRTVDVSLPRFLSGTKIDLKTPLMDMGVNSAFDSEKSDFSRILATGNRMFVNKMIQKTYIEVNEAGSEAAAVTVSEHVGTAYGESPEPLIFCADCPFVYIIYETTTNAIFFMGEFTGN